MLITRHGLFLFCATLGQSDTVVVWRRTLVGELTSHIYFIHVTNVDRDFFVWGRKDANPMWSRFEKGLREFRWPVRFSDLCLITVTEVGVDRWLIGWRNLINLNREK